MTRLSSFGEFWPYYLSQHRDPRCRAVHFIGTNGFVLLAIGCIVARPTWMIPAIVLDVVVFTAAFRIEATRNAAPVLLTGIALAVAANPAVLGAIVFAYAWAWVGHFLIEGNRPATFTYPLWSLAADYRMCGLMWRGKLWKGDTLTVPPTSETS